MNGIQQCIVSFSVFADFYDLLFPGSPEDEESGSLPGEPGLLCLGRARLYFPCPLYTSDAADDTPCVDLGGCRFLINKIISLLF